jgi:hypothetical protein
VREAFQAQGLTPNVFAVPFGDYGQHTAQDPKIPALFTELLTRQFTNFVVQDDDNDPEFSTPGEGAAGRYEIHTDTTLDQLYAWLSSHSAPEAKPEAEQQPKQAAEQHRSKSPRKQKNKR